MSNIPSNHNRQNEIQVRNAQVGPRANQAAQVTEFENKN